MINRKNMKHLIYSIITLFLLAACQQEELPSGDGVGYLSLEDITVQAANVVTTRAVDEDLCVKINDVTYGPGKTPTKIELGAGNYTLEAYNEAYTQYSSWTNDEKGEAVYYLSQQIEIEAGKVNYLRAEVPMINFGVRLKLPEGFDTAFPTNSFSVTVGDRTVSLKDGETAYFPHSEGVSVSYTLSVTNTDDDPLSQKGSSASWPAEKKPLEAGKIYVITYDYATKSLNLLAD